MNVALDPGRCTLVLVDYQQRLLPAIHRGMEVAAEAVRLADCARALGVRVVGTEHNPAGLGPNAEAILERCDRIVSKMHFNACEACCPPQSLDVVLSPNRSASCFS